MNKNPYEIKRRVVSLEETLLATNRMDLEQEPTTTVLTAACKVIADANRIGFGLDECVGRKSPGCRHSCSGQRLTSTHRPLFHFFT
jgi:hypothetical protein